MLGGSGRQPMTVLQKQWLPDRPSRGTLMSALSSTLLTPSKKDAGVQPTSCSHVLPETAIICELTCAVVFMAKLPRALMQ